MDLWDYALQTPFSNELHVQIHSSDSYLDLGWLVLSLNMATGQVIVEALSTLFVKNWISFDVISFFTVINDWLFIKPAYELYTIIEMWLNGSIITNIIQIKKIQVLTSFYWLQLSSGFPRFQIEYKYC